jgi:biopolymer transport protein ExbD/biopolymer transport protein TolR
MGMGVGGKGVKSDINVTPLVDVVLVLLIIFMVIGPMLQKGKSVQLPEAKSAEVPKDQSGDPILISITKEGDIYLDKNKIEKAMVVDSLKTEIANNPSSGLVVKGDAEVEYKKVRELLLEISKSNAQKVALAANKIKEKGE